jgi:hypothetical protein
VRTTPSIQAETNDRRPTTTDDTRLAMRETSFSACVPSRNVENRYTPPRALPGLSTKGHGALAACSPSREGTIEVAETYRGKQSTWIAGDGHARNGRAGATSQARLPDSQSAKGAGTRRGETARSSGRAGMVGSIVEVQRCFKCAMRRFPFEK